MNSHVADELTRARTRTLSLMDDLSEEELGAQHSPLMSPLVWDLAHIGNYEELWLLRSIDGRHAIDEQLDWLYNAFEHPRWTRPSLPILGPTEARNYLHEVRVAAFDLLGRVDLDADADRLLADGFVYGMVIQHEHQHDETVLATRQLMGANARPVPGAVPTPASPRAVPEGQVLIDGGTYRIGADREPWAYDNEGAAHDVEAAPFLLDRVPVTNRQFLAFVEAGGYDDARLWRPEGWAFRQEEGLAHPGCWLPDGAGGWGVLRFGTTLDLAAVLDEPVQHVCWFEADAFAVWAGKRLPTEIEWEIAATQHPTEGKRAFPWGNEPADATRANLGQRHDGPAPTGSYRSGASAHGVHQLIGDVWEWTSSDFLAYPGFEAFPYREYSEVFWGSQYKVLRGGSWATDQTAVRGSFRNWDLPIRRQIFAGFRCAGDA